MAQINIRIDDKVKREAETLFDRLGLTMSSAIMVFLRKSIAEHGIPFRVCDQNAAYHEKLLEAKRDWENGRKNYHYHTDEEVAQLMANAEKNADRKKRSPVKRTTRRRAVA